MCFHGMGYRAEASPCGKSKPLVEKGGENLDLWVKTWGSSLRGSVYRKKV